MIKKLSLKVGGIFFGNQVEDWEDWL